MLCLFQVADLGVLLWRLPLPSPRFCFPTLVSPRASLRLCTGLVIQLILGSRRTCRRESRKHLTRPESHRVTYCLVIRVNEDDLVIFVYTILVDPVRVQNSQVTTTPSDAFFRYTPQSSLGLEVVHALTNGFAIGSTCEAFSTDLCTSPVGHKPLGTCFLRLPLRTRTR